MEELVLNKLANKRQWIIESDDELTEYALDVKRQFLSIVEEGQLWSAIQQTRPSQIPAANVPRGEAGKHNQLDYQAPDGEKHRIPPASAMRPDTTN